MLLSISNTFIQKKKTKQNKILKAKKHVHIYAKGECTYTYIYKNIQIYTAFSLKFFFFLRPLKFLNHLSLSSLFFFSDFLPLKFISHDFLYLNFLNSIFFCISLLYYISLGSLSLSSILLLLLFSFVCVYICMCRYILG